VIFSSARPPCKCAWFSQRSHPFQHNDRARHHQGTHRKARPHRRGICPHPGHPRARAEYHGVGRVLGDVERALRCKNTKRELRKFPTAAPLVLVKAGEESGTARPACVPPAIGDGWAVAFKMESHNHPSAIEPFQNVAQCFPPVCSVGRNGTCSVVKSAHTGGTHCATLHDGRAAGVLVGLPPV
jgi:hypothetical protein